MSVSFLDPQQASLDAVESAESRLGFRLPDGYRRLLMEVSNGGEVEPVASQSCLAVGLGAMLGVERGDHLDIEERISQYVDRLPEGIIPVADAEGGNLVCVSLRTNDFGTVWFWDHELEMSREAVSLIAEDLDAFLVDLASIAQFDEPSAVTEAWINPSFLEELEGGG